MIVAATKQNLGDQLFVNALGAIMASSGSSTFRPVEVADWRYPCSSSQETFSMKRKFHVDGQWPRIAELNQPLRRSFVNDFGDASLRLVGPYRVASIYRPFRAQIQSDWHIGEELSKESVGLTVVFLQWVKNRNLRPFLRPTASELEQLVGRPSKGRSIIVAPEKSFFTLSNYIEAGYRPYFGGIVKLLRICKRAKTVVCGNSSTSWWGGFLCMNKTIFTEYDSFKSG